MYIIVITFVSSLHTFVLFIFVYFFFKLMAASMNAACLALMDSGLPLQCLVAAITCLVDKNDEIILDPSLQIVNVIIIHSFTKNIKVHINSHHLSHYIGGI